MMQFNRIKNYLAGFAVLVCLAGGLYGTHLTKRMQTRPKYTIGYLTDGIYSLRSGKRYGYRFRVGGKLYEDTDISESHMATARDSRFLVQYDSLDPTVSIGFFTATIPDSIASAPANGWRLPPFPIPLNARPASEDSLL